jgi:hypothetical protein
MEDVPVRNLNPASPSVVRSVEGRASRQLQVDAARLQPRCGPRRVKESMLLCVRDLDCGRWTEVMSAVPVSSHSWACSAA